MSAKTIAYKGPRRVRRTITIPRSAANSGRAAGGGGEANGDSRQNEEDGGVVHDEDEKSVRVLRRHRAVKEQRWK